MNPRELILLSPYRLPTTSSLYLGDDDVAAYLNGMRTLWHPAALLGAVGPCRAESPFDHEQPRAGQLFAVPSTPAPLLPEDWDERVRNAGAVSFRATPDPVQTLANFRAALRASPDAAAEHLALLDLEPSLAAPFHGLGLGLGQIEALFEAMSHDNVIAADELWQDVQAATTLVGTEPEAALLRLRNAADRMTAAREVLYPTNLPVVDLCLPSEDHLDEPWPAALTERQPINVIASGALLERLAREHPERLAELRSAVEVDKAEMCAGPYHEGEDPLLPLESQLHNLLRGRTAVQRLLGREPNVFARRRFGFHPQIPLLLQSVGISRGVLLAFDEAVVPTPRGSSASWVAADGKQIEVFCRPPLPADSPQTFFHLAHHLYRTITNDGSATLSLLHKGRPAHVCYHDWLALTRLAPVFGSWTTLSSYLNVVGAGDYLSAPSPDEFHSDYLVERCPTTGVSSTTVSTEPVSGFARHLRTRRRLDAAYTLAAQLRGLGSRVDTAPGEPSFEDQLAALEDRLEGPTGRPETEIEDAQKRAAESLAKRLLARALPGPGGLLVLNPCSFKRRVAIEIPDLAAPLPLEGPLKACQVDANGGRVVLETPAFGFAWLPRTGNAAAAPTAARMRLADETTVRNEFFEAEIDPVSGGLKAIRDARTRVSRLGQQLVFNPGSTMRARHLKIVSTGPALGEVVSEGALFDLQNEVLGTFRQRFRAWIGRPVLEMRIEIYPTKPPQGYPWHAYFGARFAWRDERAILRRGSLGGSMETAHTRPESPDYLEVRSGSHSTILFPGGLPFHQRHGGRMLDVILAPEGETAKAFEIGIALDREYPAQTALGLVSPPIVVPTPQGPPHIGSTGWLFHLDAPNILLTSLRPTADGSDAVAARMLECGGVSGSASWRSVRNPTRAKFTDSCGRTLADATIDGDAVQFEAAPHELLNLRIEYS